MSEVDANTLQGQILGLKRVLRAIIEDNPDIIFDEGKIGRLILEAPGRSS
jgi:hypothetical protein